MRKLFDQISVKCKTFLWKQVRRFKSLHKLKLANFEKKTFSSFTKFDVADEITVALFGLLKMKT